MDLIDQAIEDYMAIFEGLVDMTMPVIAKYQQLFFDDAMSKEMYMIQAPDQPFETTLGEAMRSKFAVDLYGERELHINLMDGRDFRTALPKEDIVTAPPEEDDGIPF